MADEKLVDFPLKNTPEDDDLLYSVSDPDGTPTDVKIRVGDLPSGAPGAPGTPGASAYEIAVDEGFVGTEAEWLESLVGPEGDPGPQGEVGPAGPQGDPGGGAALPGLTHFGGLVPVSSRATGYESVSFTDGDESMSRIRHVPFWSGRDVRFVFGNWCAEVGIAGLGQLTVTAAIETPYDVKIPITFGGRRDVVIDPGGFALSDPIGIDFGGPEHLFNFFYVRTFVVPTGGKFPTIYNGISSGDSIEYGTGLTDKTMSGTVGGDGSGRAYGPCAIVTDTLIRRPIVAVVGDSIARGEGDTPAANKPAGYPMRALDAASIPALRHAVLAQSGTRLQGFSDGAFGSGLWGTGSSSGLNWFFPLVAGATHVIHQYGVNDLYSGRTAAQTMLMMAMNWGWLAARNLEVWQTTITPITTSTDGWTTVDNQTAYSPTFQTDRVAVNDWIRAGGPIDPDDLTPVAIGTPGALVAGDVGHPLAGYFEIADAAESARNSGKWKAGYVGDGIHPNSTASPILAAAVDTNVFD